MGTKEKVIVKEDIYEILQTPVENLREDQVKFLQKVLNVNEERKKAPFKSLINVLLSVGCLFLATRCFFLPFKTLSIIAGCYGVVSSFAFAYLAHKSFTKPNYNSLSTNKWSFEQFVADNGIEKVQQKLEEYDVYTTNKILDSIKNLNYIISSCSSETEHSNEVSQSNNNENTL